MAKVSRDVSARSYIATEAFNNDFFTYTVTKTNFKTEGKLGLVTFDSSKCPAGRVLRENGRKLAPGMNPGVTTYMVGVYDNQSMLSGFIDPNAPMFAVYNNERPNFLVDNVEPEANVITDKGAPVLTNGLVSAGTTVTAGLSVTAGTNLIAPNGKLIVSNSTDSSGIVMYTTDSSGNIANVRFTEPAAVGRVSMTDAIIIGAHKKVYVYTSACSSSSHVFLTYTGLNRAGVLSAEDISDGSFRIVSTNVSTDNGGNGDAGSVQFFIVN